MVPCAEVYSQQAAMVSTSLIYALMEH